MDAQLTNEQLSRPFTHCVQFYDLPYEIPSLSVTPISQRADLKEAVLGATMLMSSNEWYLKAGQWHQSLVSRLMVGLRYPGRGCLELCLLQETIILSSSPVTTNSIVQHFRIRCVRPCKGFAEEQLNR